MGEPAAGGRGRQDRRDPFVAVDPRDLLGVIRPVDEVGTPRGWGHRDGVATVVGHLAAQLPQDLDDPLAGVVDADEPRRERRVEAVCRPRPGEVDVGATLVSHSAPVLDEQVDGQLGGGSGDLRVNSPLEPLGRLRDEPVAAGGPGNGNGVEVGGLDEDVGRRCGDLARRATHDTGDGQWHLTTIGDEEVLGVEGAGDVIEGREDLSGTCAAHPDRPRQGREVKGVQRLPDEHHDVVGDVDRERDRAHPQLSESGLHPLGRGRRRVDPADDARDIAVAALHPVERGRVDEVHGISLGGVGGHSRDEAGVAEGAGRAALRVPVLPGDAAHREAVAAVGSDVDLDDLLAEPEQRNRVVTGLEGRRSLRPEVALEDDDPGMV